MYENSKIYNYVFSNPVSSDVEHLMHCEELRYEFKQKNLNIDSVGCPSNFGLDEYDGLCFEEDLDNSITYKQSVEMCRRCWKIALEI
jgi:hypothetical protein